MVHSVWDTLLNTPRCSVGRWPLEQPLMTEESQPLKVFGFGAMYAVLFPFPPRPRFPSSFHLPHSSAKIKAQESMQGTQSKDGAKIACGKEVELTRVP